MWYCDHCGEKIENVEDGWIEWKRDSNKSDKNCIDIQLVHHNSNCMYDEIGEYNRGSWLCPGSHLEHFLESNGLMKLLEFLQLNSFETNEEIYEMIKRLHINNYDIARRHLDEAYHDGIIDSYQKEKRILWQGNIIEALTKYGD